MSERTETPTDSDDDVAPLPKYELRNPERAKERAEKSGKYGVMYAPNYGWSAPECTKQAYGLGRGKKVRHGKPDRPSMEWRSLKFHTGWLTRLEAVECIDEIPRYNRFDPDVTKYAVSVMPPTTRVVVGRESSPVLYFWTDKPYVVGDILHRLDYVVSEGENGNPRAVARHSPDELDAYRDARTYPKITQGDNPKTAKGWTLIRAWWD